MKEVIKTGILGVVVACISLGVAYGVWVFSQPSESVTREDSVTICTADAMQCPDGTYVGRTGPDCQFVCPKPGVSTVDEKTIEAKLGVATQGSGIKIIPMSIVQDSRCPTDVECIWAGTVKIKLLIESGVGTSSEQISLGESITIGTKQLKLVSVSPSPSSTRVITSDQYVFTFELTERS